MKNQKKSIFARFASTLLTVMAIAVVFSFCAVSASAAEMEPQTVAAVAVAELPVSEIASLHASPLTQALPAAAMQSATIKIMPMAGATPTSTTATSSDDTYKQVVNFFITWIRRIGVLVGFVGAVMFGLAIKNNDAEQKQAGLLTMIAGFVVAAVCQAADMFDLFT